MQVSTQGPGVPFALLTGAGTISQDPETVHCLLGPTLLSHRDEKAWLACPVSRLTGLCKHPLSPSKLMDVRELFPVPSLTASWLYSSPSWKSFTLGLPRGLSGSPSLSLVCEWVISNIVLRFFYTVPSIAHLRSHLGEH